MGYAVDYMITPQCNLKCPFCYGPPQDMQGELELSSKLTLIEGLVRGGVSHVIFGGGEPLVSPDAVPAIVTARKLGAQVGLQTNAFAAARFKEVLPYLDWVGLPIDGVSNVSQRHMRTSPNQLARTTQAVDVVRGGAFGTPKIKIGTVITPSTLPELFAIAAIVDQLRPNIWKWYEVRPRGEARAHYDSLYVSPSDIQQALSSVRAAFPHLNIFCSFRQQGDRAYLIVNPDSEALLPNGEDYISFGPLVAEAQFRSDVWERYTFALDQCAQVANMKSTFPQWTD